MPGVIVVPGVLWLIMALGGLGLDVVYILMIKDDNVDLVRLEIMFAPGVVASIVMLVFAFRTLTRRARSTLGAGITSIVVGGVLWIAYAVIRVMTEQLGTAGEVEWALTLAPIRGLLCIVAGAVVLAGRKTYKELVA